jgi:hypothetical protein
MFREGLGNFYNEGGWGMWPTTFFGFFLIAWAVLFAWRRAAPVMRPVLTTLNLLVLGAGVLGTTVGLIATLRGARQVEPGDRLLLVCAGTAESLNNLVLAFIFVMLTLCITALGQWRATRQPV